MTFPRKRFHSVVLLLKILAFLLSESFCWSNEQKQSRVGDIQENAFGAIMYVSPTINTVRSCKLARVG